MTGRITTNQANQIHELFDKKLPPIVSEEALAVMIGVNSGLIWSFVNRPRRHYRLFELPKGNGVRQICAPRVALKVIQKWLSSHITDCYQAPAHVFGFVPGRSHIEAARVHQGAQWAYSADLENFFGTTPMAAVQDAFRYLGYDESSAELCAKLTCFGGVLAQGAPTSPALSNICFRAFDDTLVELAHKYDCQVTRYADDIVFSGQGAFIEDLRTELAVRLEATPWKLAPQKNLVQPIKGRIKVHGLLVKEGVRLTKGYRNQIRAYSHILAKKGMMAENSQILRGHVQYAKHVSNLTGSPSGISEKNIVILEKEVFSRKRLAFTLRRLLAPIKRLFLPRS
jgi:hypothetical protein